MRLRGIRRRVKKICHSAKAARYSEKDICLIDITQKAAEINKILAETERPFVGFTDPQADFGEDYFLKLLRELVMDGEADSAIGSLCDHKGNPVPCSGDLKKECVRLDAETRFTFVNLHLCGVVCRTEVIRKAGLRFDEELNYCRDELFAVQFAEQAPVSVRLNHCIYKTGLVLDESSDMTPQSQNIDWYFDSAVKLMNKMKRDGRLSEIAQFSLLFLLIQRFRSNQGQKIKMVFDTPERCVEYLEQAGEIMRNISDEVLCIRTRATKWERYKKIYLAQLRNPHEPLRFDIRKDREDARLYLRDSDAKSALCGLSDIRLSVVIFHYEADSAGRPGLDIIFQVMHCYPSNSFEISFVCEDDKGEKKYRAELLTELAGTVTFFDRDAARRDAYHVFIPVTGGRRMSVRGEMQFGEYIYPKRISFSDVWQNKLSSNLEGSYWYTDSMLIDCTGGIIRIRPASEEARQTAEKKYLETLEKRLDSMKEGTRERKQLQKALRWRKLYWETFEEYKDRRIWTYNDKAFKAGDNAEYALRYAAGQSDGIEKLFYIEKSVDGERLRKQGYTVMRPGTDEAALAALHAEVIYMTHVPPYRKLGIADGMLRYLKDLMNPKIIRLYHGFPITRSASYAQMANDAAAVAVGSAYEKILYTNEENCFLPEQIIESGMPRYDDLIDDSRKQILFAPTWRPSLCIGIGKDGKPQYNRNYRSSAYFRLYEQVLRDDRLLDTAKKNGYKIKFFLHPKMSAQARDHESDETVQSLSCTVDIDYVTIMRQSDLMVTDYSSVQYDFAYMRKPVVYYHDPALPYWRITNFDYEGIGFGEICRSAEQLVTVLCDYMEHGCVLKPAYEKRIEDFFLHDDHQAAKRLYEATRALTDKA